MSRVRIEVGGYLIRKLGSQDLEGQWEREIEFSPGTRVRGALCRLAQEEPDFSDAICDGERLRPEILLMINDKLQNWLSAEQVELSDGDRVSFWPMVAGG